MKTLLTITALVFTVTFSSPSFAEWKEVTESVKGTTFYVDFERIRKHGGYVYFWDLRDYLKPDKWGDMSSKIYNQVDCKLFRYKFLSSSFYKEPMGNGLGDAQEIIAKHKGWRYPPPSSAGETILKRVCSQ